MSVNEREQGRDHLRHKRFRREDQWAGGYRGELSKADSTTLTNISTMEVVTDDIEAAFCQHHDPLVFVIPVVNPPSNTET